jgi:hypothetical protein
MFRPTRQEFVFKKAEPAIVAKEWTFDPASILSSPRKVKGKFHTPKIDMDNEYIENAAIQNAVPDFMHLPILHDFHKERTVGIVTRVVELSDGSFDFEGLIKATDDCNDIWELITKGNYDQVSIYGKRTAGSGSCSVRPEQRMEPCTTTGVRLDSISVCDANARNDGTSLFVAKGAKVVFTATDEIIKAETTNSELMHTVTDYPKEHRDGLPRTKKKCTATCPQYERQELGKGYDNPQGQFEGEVDARNLKDMYHLTEHGTTPHNEWEKKGDDMDEDVKQKPIRVGDKAKRKEPSQGEDYHDGKFEKGAESIEEKLDHLCTVVERLVGMDEGASPHSTDQVEPSGKEEWSEQPNAESDREYGLPAPSGGEPEEDPLEEDKAFQTKTQSAKDSLDERAVAMPDSEKPKRSESLTSEDDLNHLAARYHLEKRVKEQANVAPSAEAIGKKQAYTESVMGRSRGEKKEEDSPTSRQFTEPEAKANNPKLAAEREAQNTGSANSPEPDYSRPEAELQEYKRKQAGKEVSAKLISSQPGYKDRRTGGESHKQKPTAPPWAKEPLTHSSKDKGNVDESENVRSKEAPVKRPESISSEDTKKPATTADKKMNPPTPDKQGPDAPVNPHTRRQPDEPHQATIPNQKPAVENFGGGTEAGTSRTNYTPGQARIAGSPSDKPEPYKPKYSFDEDEEKSDSGGEMPDIESRIDRLIEVVSRLVQSDEKVHAGMEQKGTYTSTENEISYPHSAGKFDKHTQDVRRHNQQVSDHYKNTEEEKCSIRKGTETMNDEEVNTIVKAKVEEITKAYQVSLDELKKANTDLVARIDKMEKETIEKSGVVAILREGDEDMGTVFQSNASAISSMKPKAKV